MAQHRTCLAQRVLLRSLGMKAPAKPFQRNLESTLFALSDARSIPVANKLERMIGTDASLLGGIAVSERGELLARAGETDAETAGGVAVLALRAVREIAAELGLGRARSFHASWGAASISVVCASGETLVCVGRSHKNGLQTWKRLRGLWT